MGAMAPAERAMYVRYHHGKNVLLDGAGFEEGLKRLSFIESSNAKLLNVSFQMQTLLET